MRRATLRIAVSVVVICTLLAPAAATIRIADDGTTAVKRIAQVFRRRGLECGLASHDELVSAPDTARDVWVLTHAGTCRADVTSAVVAHLRNGGGLLVLGEPPFQQTPYPLGGRWLPQSSWLAANLSPTPLVSISTDSLSRFDLSSDLPQGGPTLTAQQDTRPPTDSTRTSSVAVVRIPKMGVWTTYTTTVTAAAMPPRNALTTFWARGSTTTRQLAVEWREKDGSRWIAVINLSPQWQYYVLPPRDFTFFVGSPVPGRGSAGDCLRMDNIGAFSIGLAQTHTNTGPAPHEFAFTGVGWVPADSLSKLACGEPPAIDGLCPLQNVYPLTAPARSEVAEGFTNVGDLPLPARAWSSFWRPMGGGFEMQRQRRFIPVVTALNSDGGRAGTFAAIHLNFENPYPNAVYGSVSIDDDTTMLSDPWLALAAEMAQRISDRAFLKEAGSTDFTYDVRDIPTSGIRMGLSTIRTGTGDGRKTTVRASLTSAGRTLWSADAQEGSDGIFRLEQSVPYRDEFFSGLEFRAEVRRNDRLVDVIRHEIGFDGPRKNALFVTARDRMFWRGGRPFRWFGVNYMPSSGLGRDLNQKDNEEFEFYLRNASYDPEIVETDLRRIAGLGMNMITPFIYFHRGEKSALLDLLRRARKHGLAVNLFVRPNTMPFAAPDTVLEGLTALYRLGEKDEIMAYDVACEPWWGRHDQRLKQGPLWKQWVEKKYGSVEKAEQQWKHRLGSMSIEEFPSNDQLDSEGPWLAGVNDYRAFVDETLTADYSRARATLRRVAPHQMMSFRESDGACPTVVPSWMPIELRSICSAVDFYAPEGYGLRSTDQQAAAMLFAASYGQGLSPGKPMIWAEFGISVWSGSAFEPLAEPYAEQARVFERIYDYAQRSRAAGAVAWFFPGGYRQGEISDYGILNPDGTPRPATAVIRKWAPTMKSPPPPVQWTPTIRARRSDSVRGYASIYERISKEFFDQVTSDTIPLIVTER